MRSPTPRCPLSAALIGRLPAFDPAARFADVFVNDPFNNDVQLSLFMCYQLHFGGFDGVDASWE